MYIVSNTCINIFYEENYLGIRFSTMNFEPLSLTCIKFPTPSHKKSEKYSCLMTKVEIPF